MNVSFDPLLPAERQAVARLIAILEGADAPTALIPAESAKPSRARKAVEAARYVAEINTGPGGMTEAHAERFTEELAKRVPSAPVPPKAPTPAMPVTAHVVPDAIPVQEPVKRVEIVVVDEIKPDPVPTEPSKTPTVEELRNALVAYAGAMAAKADATLDAAARAAWGKDQARKVLNETGKSASVSAVPEHLRAAVIAACKA